MVNEITKNYFSDLVDSVIDELDQHKNVKLSPEHWLNIFEQKFMEKMVGDNDFSEPSEEEEQYYDGRWLF